MANGNGKFSVPYHNSEAVSNVEEGKYKAFSQLFSSRLKYVYSDDQKNFSRRINENEDLFITINNATPAVLSEHFERKQSPERPVYDIFLPTKWKKIVLNDKLSPDNGVDTDGDCLTDWEEVDTIRLIWRADGSFSLPEIKLSYILRDVSRFNSPEFQALLSNGKPIHYIPVISDPSMSDSDGDDLTDEEELYSNTMMFCADTDGDGLSDGEEVDLWFDPTNANYDGDSYDDKEELENDTSPFVYDLNLAESAKA
ncbi:MAG TPA: hypothetical protein P5191_16310 [Ruminococcus sp.]|nr:hypothetical protein [Ruminococcus sp.]